MNYVRLGETGVKVSQLCLGTWHLPPSKEVDTWGVPRVDEELALKIMRRAYDSGVNCIDTANGYHGILQSEEPHHVGNAERIVGNFLAQVERESVLVFTKVRAPIAPWPNGEGLSRKHIRWQIRESLRRLRTQYVDLYQIHWRDPETPRLETLRTLDWLVREGKVNYIGESNHPAHEIVDFLRLSEVHGLEKFVTMQEPYSLVERWIEREKVPVAKEHGLAILAFVPLAQGLLTGKYVDFQARKWRVPEMSRATYVKDFSPSSWFNEANLNALLRLKALADQKGVSMAQLSLAWLIKRGEELGVTVIPLMGATKLEHLEDNLGALEVKLSQDDVRELEEVSKSFSR